MGKKTLNIKKVSVKKTNTIEQGTRVTAVNNNNSNYKDKETLSSVKVVITCGSTVVFFLIAYVFVFVGGPWLFDMCVAGINGINNSHKAILSQLVSQYNVNTQNAVRPQYNCLYIIQR